MHVTPTLERGARMKKASKSWASESRETAIPPKK